MTSTLGILVEARNGDWVELLILLGFLVISAIVGVLRKASERRADERDLQERRGRSESQQASDQAPQRRYKPIPTREQGSAQPPPQPPRQQPQPRPQPHAAQVRRQQSQTQTPEALRSAQVYRQRRRDAELREKQRAAIHKQQQEQAELKRRQEALKRRSAAVARKTAAGKEPDPLAQLRGLTGQMRFYKGQEGPKGYTVNLQSAADARRAMVYHEIFSRPKAMRRGPELWDM